MECECEHDEWHECRVHADDLEYEFEPSEAEVSYEDIIDIIEDNLDEVIRYLSKYHRIELKETLQGKVRK
ncbi:hypothetical protein [Saccharolobus shibatae]|uniref:hypothetical protein n=1 Tax=Saccharolobus shibatae TaxID=2286 RepID=UPI001C45EEEF|nr:hypothetical protein [Saccharolobus shibatae]